MRTNYVLIDYESVQPETLEELEHDHFKLLVFAGASQTKVSLQVAAAMQRMGTRADYVQISGNGPNALDFHIAYYIGKIAVTEPDAFFHIVSKDKGFDPLIRHLKTKGIFAARSPTVDQIPAVKAATATSPDAQEAIVLAKLRHMGSGVPKTLKTLRSTMAACLQKPGSDPELDTLLEHLQASGTVTVVGTKVAYALPA